MKLIFNSQISIFEDIFYKYLTPKQCTKLYTSNLILYNIFVDNNKFESNYYTPKTNIELNNSVDEWYINKKEAMIRYGNIEYWNTIYITNMRELFCDKSQFNDNISDWNTSNVINMAHMFHKASKFNQNLNNWNINKLININYMFYGARNLNKLHCKELYTKLYYNS